MTITVDWLLGSAVVPSAGYAYTINGTGYGIAAGTFYLDDPTNSRSAIYQLEADLVTEGITNASVFLTQAGYVKITGDVNFAIVWTDTAFRDLLGFTGNIGSTQSATASLYSPLFWSPGYQGTPAYSPGGIVGTKINDTAHTVSPSGQTGQATKHTTRIVQRYDWNMVYIDRVWTTDEDGLGGEFRRFYDDVLSAGQRFKLYPAIAEDRTSTSAASLTTPLGPYKIPKNDDQWYRRQIASADLRSSISIECYQTAEAS